MVVVALSSEPQTEADQAKEDWKVEGDDFKFIGDPTNLLALYLRSNREYLPGLEIVGPGSPLKNKYGGFAANKNHSKLSSLKWYPHGCLQPGCLIVSPAMAGDPTILYRWTLESGVSNGGGAGGRPLWTKILSAVCGQFEKLERGEKVVPIEGHVSWGRTVRDLFTCIFKAPITMLKYSKSNKNKTKKKQ
jgi:hypothetical protein